MSEEPVWGCEPVTLESESLPRCPPGPVASPVRWVSSRRFWSATIRAYTMLDRRLLSDRIAINDGVESIALVYDDTGERVPAHAGAVTA